MFTACELIYNLFYSHKCRPCPPGEYFDDSVRFPLFLRFFDTCVSVHCVPSLCVRMGTELHRSRTAPTTAALGTCVERIANAWIERVDACVSVTLQPVSAPFCGRAGWKRLRILRAL